MGRAEVGLVLTSGDVAVFRWLWLLRVLSLDQIRRLHYVDLTTGVLSHPDNVRKRMARLAEKEQGYLLGARVEVVPELRRLGEGEPPSKAGPRRPTVSHERVYVLTEKGLLAVASADGRAQRRLYVSGLEGDKVGSRHTQLVSECAVRVVEGIRGSDVTLAELEPWGVPFYTTNAVGNARSKRHTARYVTQEDVIDGGHRHRVRPDLVFGLTRSGGTRLYFVEADRGGERPSEIVAKLAAYGAFERQHTDRWRSYAPTVEDFRVLLVTTTETRVRGLLTWLKGKPGGHLARITTWREFRRDEGGSRNVVFDPIWTRVEDDGSPIAGALLRRG